MDYLTDSLLYMYINFNCLSFLLLRCSLHRPPCKYHHVTAWYPQYTKQYTSSPLLLSSFYFTAAWQALKKNSVNRIFLNQWSHISTHQVHIIIANPHDAYHATSVTNCNRYPACRSISNCSLCWQLDQKMKLFILSGGCSHRNIKSHFNGFKQPNRFSRIEQKLQIIVGCWPPWLPEQMELPTTVKLKEHLNGCFLLLNS